jgi:hypothetical protein
VIVVQSVIDDSGRQRRVRVEVTEEDYRAAIRAHEEGFQIRVSGNLDIRGNSFTLEQISGFELVGGLEQGG